LNIVKTLDDTHCPNCINHLAALGLHICLRHKVASHSLQSGAWRIADLLPVVSDVRIDIAS